MASSEAALAAAGGAAAVLVLGYLLAARRDNDGEKRRSRERTAEASFRVRRSQLQSLAGGGSRKKPRQRGDRGRRRGSPSLDDDEGEGPPSRIGRLVASLQRILSGAWSLGSSSARTGDAEGSAGPRAPQRPRTRGEIPPERSMAGYYDEFVVVGLDCEMVGGGRGGETSLLARCSVVALPHEEAEAPTEGGASAGTAVPSLDRDLAVLYDKYVVPKGKITDYRTEWSGITKETYRRGANASSPLPIVSFQQCQNEVARLFSSLDGKRVVVVGHALENDFDALEIEHPASLTRDTAFYPPYMRRVKRRLFSRKLSTLSREELGIEIQQSSSATVGHSSVEDAAAALRLYWSRHGAWERWLGYPLAESEQPRGRDGWPPLTMYLDGCNLPIGMRGVDFKKLMRNTEDLPTTHISSKTFRLTSRKRDSDRPSNISDIDWMPLFHAAVAPNATPRVKCISVMFDGAKFRNIDTKIKGKKVKDSLETRTFWLDSITAEEAGAIRVEITEDGASADDVLCHQCAAAEDGDGENTAESTRKPAWSHISLDEAIDLLSDGDGGDGGDDLSHYVVVRRTAGGTKTHRKLFDKLHLRRPDEGALCLASLTPGLRKHGLRTARELRRERGIERVIACERRPRGDLRAVVVTNDVFLTERLVQQGVLVLSFRQLMHLF